MSAIAYLFILTTYLAAVHHVMARADRVEEIFRDDRGRCKFLGYLAEGAGTAISAAVLPELGHLKSARD